ncbi:MAG: thioesterase family protein [Pseudomonadota bacterium]|nr:thioesterase family protein [Pseudomonadota bacterium]
MTAPANASPLAFEPEFIDALRLLFDEHIVFNRHIGLRVSDVRPDGVQCRIDMREELIGHFGHRRIHGGVISAALDAAAGLAVMAAIGARHMHEPPAERLRRFDKLGTIDLRVDYLRPGIGPHFMFSAEVLRLGSRVANARMACHGADGTLLATGAAAYIVS